MGKKEPSTLLLGMAITNRHYGEHIQSFKMKQKPVEDPEILQGLFGPNHPSLKDTGTPAHWELFTPIAVYNGQDTDAA